MLGRPLFANLPNDYSRLFRSYSECRLLTKGALAVEFDRLAGRMIGQERDPAPPAADWLSSLGLFGRKGITPHNISYQKLDSASRPPVGWAREPPARAPQD